MSKKIYIVYKNGKYNDGKQQGNGEETVQNGNDNQFAYFIGDSIIIDTVDNSCNRSLEVPVFKLFG